MNRSLPVFELKIDPDKDSVVNAIALVEEPAIEKNFIAFSAEKQIEFAANEDKMELIGPALIPDMKIYRRDKDGEYEVFFSSETIRQIAQVYFSKSFQNNINLDHSSTLAKSYVFQSYIVDSSLGLSSPKGFDLPDGSWVVGIKVTDKQVWKDIKAGKQKGFSIEGVFQMFEKQKKANKREALAILQQIEDYLLQTK